MIKTLTLEEFTLYYGDDEDRSSGYEREMKQKRSNVYEPHVDEIRVLLESGATVADIHRVINRRHNLGYTVEVLRRLIHWQLKDCMPKGRRWANQYGVRMS